uniref:Very-long-chain (3R)-3-hydroxyacyl-CoA dehydratase n=1 Tax=Monodelphis domestica TaxID=13616 RepID=F6PRX6_MONDO
MTVLAIVPRFLSGSRNTPEIDISQPPQPEADLGDGWPVGSYRNTTRGLGGAGLCSFALTQHGAPGSGGYREVEGGAKEERRMTGSETGASLWEARGHLPSSKMVFTARFLLPPPAPTPRVSPWPRLITLTPPPPSSYPLLGRAHSASSCLLPGQVEIGILDMAAAATAVSSTTKGNGTSGRSGPSEAGGPRKKKGPGPLATAYLVIYNVVMTAGWLVIAVGLVRAYLAKGSYHSLYFSIEKPLKFFQTGALLEILHCAIGIVPSSVVLTSFQVMSRVFLIWAVTHSVKEVQSEDSVLLFVIAWTVTEIIRYSFYTFSLLNHLPYIIKWARYTLFIVLYPMGVSGELLTIYAALPFVRQANLYSISLPNKYNFSFDYYAFLILIMISYIPLFPQLYLHMIHQRRKVLSHPEEQKKYE